MAKGLTLQELQAMGAKPAGGLTLQELQAKQQSPAPQEATKSFSEQLWTSLSSPHPVLSAIGAGVENIKKAPETIKTAFSAGVEKTKQGAADFKTAQTPVQQAESILKTGAGVASAVTAPIAPVMEPISEVINKGSEAASNNPTFQKAAMLLPEFDYKRVAASLENVGTIAGTVAGGLDTPRVLSGVKKNLTPTPRETAPIKTNATVDKAIADTMPYQSKDVRIEDLRNTFPDSGNGTGGVKREGIFGKSASQPGPDDIRRGTIANEYIGGVKDPVERIGKVNQGIRDTSAKTDTFLDQKAAPGNFADMRDYMETNRPNRNLQKDPGAAEAYQRATQDALDTLYETMQKAAKESGDFGPIVSGKDIRAARIAIDQQIAAELGENVFGTPQFKGIKAAEIDTRNLLNRMAEDLIRYPGQMEKLNRLNSFLVQSRARGIEVDMANPAIRAHLEKEFGLKPTGEADAAKLAADHAKMSDLYDARDNMIDNYQASLGKNKVQEAIKRNPFIKGALNMGKQVIPFGIGNQL